MKTIDTHIRVLQFLGIIFVVMGHVRCQFFTADSWFPYYSFHMPLFSFFTDLISDALTSVSFFFTGDRRSSRMRRGCGLPRKDSATERKCPAEQGLKCMRLLLRGKSVLSAEKIERPSPWAMREADSFCFRSSYFTPEKCIICKQLWLFNQGSVKEREAA